MARERLKSYEKPENNRFLARVSKRGPPTYKSRVPHLGMARLFQ